MCLVSQCTGFVPKQCVLWSELFRSLGVCSSGPTRKWWSLCLVSRRAWSFPSVVVALSRLQVARPESGTLFPKRHGIIPGLQPGFQQKIHVTTYQSDMECVDYIRKNLCVNVVPNTTPLARRCSGHGPKAEPSTWHRVEHTAHAHEVRAAWHRKHRIILLLCPVLLNTVVHNVAIPTVLNTLKQSVCRLSLLQSRHRSHCHLCDSRQGISTRRLRISSQDLHSSASSERTMSPGCAHGYHPRHTCI